MIGQAYIVIAIVINQVVAPSLQQLVSRQFGEHCSAVINKDIVLKERCSAIGGGHKPEADSIAAEQVVKQPGSVALV